MYGTVFFCFFFTWNRILNLSLMYLYVYLFVYVYPFVYDFFKESRHFSFILKYVSFLYFSSVLIYLQRVKWLFSFCPPAESK